MPALSPTMETGSISKWSLKVGDKFEAGTAICEVETDKATVTYEATEDGYIAKILVGSGDVKVGQPLMITVDEASSVGAFANYSSPVSAPAAPTAAPVAAAPTPAPVAAAAPAAPTPSPATAPQSSGRVFASPLARKLARESGIDLSRLVGSGPNGRIVSADVLSAPAPSATPAVATTTTTSTTSNVAPVTQTAPSSSSAAFSSVDGVYRDFELSDLARSVAARLTASKQQVPHYCVSVEINLSKLLKLRSELNAQSASTEVKGKASSELAVLDFVVKAAALSMSQVPDVNAAWGESFVRRYEQVDINVVMGTGSSLVTPVIRDVASKGLKSISSEISHFEDSLFSEDGSQALDASKLQLGTFSIHNLGIFGVKSAAPIVLPPQSCALALGAIQDVVVPNLSAKEGEDNWKVAPVLTATLSLDHRVVDGAVGAQWLSAFKTYLENPITMIL